MKHALHTFYPRRLALSLIVLFSIAMLPASAQVETKYTYQGTGTASYTSLPSGATVIHSGTDAGGNWYQGGAVNTPGSGIPIGFSFTYNCQTYTTIGISTNGYIWFGTGTPATGSQLSPVTNSSNNLGGTGTISGIIAAWAGATTGNAGTRACGTGGEIDVSLSGTAPNRVFQIEWNGYYLSSANSTGSGATATPGNLIKLNENGGTNDGVFEIDAKSQAAIGISGNDQGQIGMRGLSNSDFELLSGWTATTESATSTNVATINSSQYCNGNKYYKWKETNSSCCTPPATSATSFTKGSYVVSGSSSTATIGFTRGTGNNGVIVLGAMDAVPTFTPANGSAYTGGSAAFGSGTAEGNGYLIYNSTTAGDGVSTVSIPLTNLTSGHSYYFTVYEISNSATDCYQITPLSGSFCIGPPAVGTISASVNPVCPGVSSSLTLNGTTSQATLTYQWQSSATSGSGYANASGTSTNSTYATPTTLPSSPVYYVSQVTCGTTGGGTTQSNQLSVSTNSFLNCYCNPTYSTGPGASADAITYITLAGNTVTDNFAPGNLASPYYATYSTNVPDLSVGSSYTLSVKAGTKTTEAMSVWVDYDHSGTFDASNSSGVNENIGTASSGNYSNTAKSFSFTVPASAISGTTIMRILDARTTTPASACASMTNGETENIQITIAACSGPSTQASNFVTDPSPTTTSCNVKFTRGNGTGGMIVVCNAGSTPQAPTPGTLYSSPNANITAGGSTTAAGSFVIYNATTGSSGTQITVPATNLTPGTTYYFAAYEWNTSASCYNLVSAPNGTVVIPLCIQPTTQVSSVSAGTPATTSATLTWTAGNGDHTLVLLKQGSPVSSAPALTTTYTDNGNYNYGSPSGSQIGTGNYVMFGDAGAANATSANITGLTPSTTYYYAVYTYFSASHCYYLTSPITGSFTTASCSPATAASNMVFSNITNSGLTGTFTRGSGSNVLVVARLTATAQVYPTYNTTYTVNNVFGSGTGSAITGTGNYVVYNGTGNTFSVSSLANASAYTFDVYEYNASPNCYVTTSYSSAQTTLDATTSGGCSASVAWSATGMTQITPTTTLTSSNTTNTNYTNQPIGFNFVYNGTTYTTFGLNTNGFIWFQHDGLGTPAATETTPLSDASANLGGSGTIDGVIAGMGAFLSANYTNPSTTSIGYAVTGTAPNRVLTIQWLGYSAKNASNNCYTGGYVDTWIMDFQIQLNEHGGTNSDQIAMVYNNMGPYCLIGSSVTAQVGLRGADNTTYTTRTGTGSAWGNTAGGSNSAVCTCTNSNWITGITLTFTQASTVGPTLSVGSLNCPADNIVLTGGSGYASYQWFEGGSVVPGPGSSSSTYTVPSTGSGTYTVVGKNGSCYLASTATPVTVGTCCSSNTWVGGSSGHTTDWFTAANWSCGSIPTATNDVVIPTSPSGGNYFPYITSGAPQIALAKNLTIQTGASVTIDPVNVELDVAANFVNNGTASLGTGKLVVVAPSGAQTVTGNVTVGSFVVNNAAGVTIASGSGNSLNVSGTLTLKLGQLTTNNNLTITSNASGAGLIDDFSGTNAGTISGNLTVQRYAVNPSSGFYYLGAPVGGATLSQYSGVSLSAINGATDGTPVTPAVCSWPTGETLASGSAYGNLFDYRESTVTSCYLQGWHVRTGGNATVGQGFAGYVPNATVLSLNGSFNTGTKTVTLSKVSSVAHAGGFNLISNPYASPIDWLQVASETGPNVSSMTGTAYLYESSGTYAGSYQPINLSSSSTLIGSSQAFFVLASSNGATFTFNNSMRSATPGNTFLRSKPVFDQKITMNLTGNGYADVTNILFGHNFTENLDYGYDAFKMISTAGHPSVYVTDPTNAYSIYAIPSVTQNQRDIPVSFLPGANGQFNFSVDLNSFDPTALVFLEDLQTHTVQNLMVNPAYSFTSNTSDDPARFVLHFMPAATISVTPADCNGQNGLVVADLGQYTVAGQPISWTSYSMTTANGTVASVGNLTNNLISVANLPDGVYNLQLNMNGYTATKQIQVINKQLVVTAFAPNATVAHVGDDVVFNNTTTGATEYNWTFGDGNVSTLTSPSHIYSNVGTYQVILNANNPDCSGSVEKTIQVESIATGINGVQAEAVKITGYATDVNIEFSNFTKLDEVTVNIYDLTGRKIIAPQTVSTGDNKNVIHLTDIVTGYYFVVLTGKGYENSEKVFLGSH